MAELSERVMLEQLAEEAMEMGQAALKLIRARHGSENPTPVSEEEAFDRLIHEIADVLACMIVWENARDIDVDMLFRITIDKLLRWNLRLSGNTAL